jgi:hypothetical protein
MQRLTAGDFVLKILEGKASSLVINSQQELELAVEGDDNRYVGPDPVITGYVSYMQFLGAVEQASGLKSLVRSYMMDRLR